jgi:AraC-like DNA-binding protein
MSLPETEVLKQYNLIGDAIYYHHVRTEATGGEYLHPSEAHASYEMLLLLEGEISYIIEGETYTAGPGDMIFVAPGEIHAIRIDGRKPYERLVLLFDIDALRSMMHELCAPLEVFSQEAGERLHIVPRALVSEYGLDRLLGEIFSCEDEDRYKRLFIMSKLLGFMIQTDKMFSAHKERFASPTSKDGLVSAAVTYIGEHISEPIRLEDVADHLFVSKSTLCHRFAKTVHMTTMHYILLKKMHRASDLLRNGYSASEAAAMVGYSNYTSFYYNFKRLMGRAPAERGAGK